MGAAGVRTTDLSGAAGARTLFGRAAELAQAVEDLDAAVAALGAEGVDLIGGPMEVAEIAQRIAFIPDNLGNIIELTEPGNWSSARPSVI